MTTPDKVDDAIIWATAHWWDSPRPLVPFLMRKFHISEHEALVALRKASNDIARPRE